MSELLSSSTCRLRLLLPAACCCCCAKVNTAPPAWLSTRRIAASRCPLPGLGPAGTHRRARITAAVQYGRIRTASSSSGGRAACVRVDALVLLSTARYSPACCHPAACARRPSHHPQHEDAKQGSGGGSGGGSSWGDGAVVPVWSRPQVGNRSCA